MTLHTSRTLKIAALASLTALGLGTAQAQGYGKSTSQDTGYYLGGQIGGAHLKDSTPLGSGLDTADTGFKLYGGYSFTPNLALELGYVDLGKFSHSLGSIKAQGVFLDAVGLFPIAPQWSVLGRVGVVDTRTKVDVLGLTDKDSATNLKVGAGLQYDITPSTSVRGEWERYRIGVINDKANVDLYSLGVVVKF